MIVLIGNQMRADTAIVMKTPELAVVMTWVGTSKSVATSATAVMMELLAKVAGKVIQQTTNSVVHFCHVGNFATVSSDSGTAGPAGFSDFVSRAAWLGMIAFVLLSRL